MKVSGNGVQDIYPLLEALALALGRAIEAFLVGEEQIALPLERLSRKLTVMLRMLGRLTASAEASALLPAPVVQLEASLMVRWVLALRDMRSRELEVW
jgi:hypothetical protein